MTIPRQNPVARTQRLRRLTAAGLALCLSVSPLAFSTSAIAQDLSKQAPATGLAARLPSFQPMVKKVLPAVVNISVVEKTATSDGSDGDSGDDGDGMPPGMMGPGTGTPFDEFMRRFFQQQQQGQTPNMAPGQHVIALGSGFIIDPRGYIVTNHHVIGNAEKVTVIFQDGSRHTAKIVGKDKASDLALLKIDVGHPLPYVTFGDSDKTDVGDWVIAVGDPFGLGGTVTSGILSARGRPIGDSSYVDFLQIDAPINKGNSGGPTFNLDGQVIGINTAIYSPNGGSVGIGFDIPSDSAKPIIAQLMKSGHVDRGWLGVQVQQMTPDIAQGLGMDRNNPSGALVASVTPSSPAGKAGIQAGDVIEKYDGKSVSKMRDLPRMVADTTIGQTVPVTVMRQGKEVTEQVTIGKLTSQEVADAQGTAQSQQGENDKAALGMTLSSLTSDAAKRLNLPSSIKGALVSRVQDDSPAYDNGIEAGDVIVSVNNHSVENPKDAAKLIQANAKGVMLLLINRHGENRFVTIDQNGGGEG
ncbi:MAG TPA: DegQ family serine endoprotease [Stellaceae bacterium]|nr:DegQ family serine endoprotease [Stellaceae bacterium]